MKHKSIKPAIICVAVIVVAFAFAACGGEYYPSGSDNSYYKLTGGDNYSEITEYPFIAAADCPDSNISLTVNTAAYSQLKNYINKGYDIPEGAVKIEEMINYFSYDYGEPTDGEVFKLNAAITDTPWNDDTKLLTVGMRAKRVSAAESSHNLVFLVDVSGSMHGNDRLELAKKTFIGMLDVLGADDTVSIVTYSGSVRTVLDGAKGSEKSKITKAINKLSAGGSTAGGSGINEAYRCAFKHQTDNNNSRIIIATDGDFNVGAASADELKELIGENRSRGVYMSALGFGMGNLSDVNMQEIVNSGQGTYAFIDSLDEAYSLTSPDRIDGILTVAAEEAKAQLSFDPAMVDSYRMIGYENRSLTDEEWEDSTTPAGAIAGGTTVTAVYELKLKKDGSGDVAEFTTKYHEPRGKAEQSRSLVIDGSFMGAADGKDCYIKSADSGFIAAVVEVGLILRNSAYKGEASLESVLGRLDPHEPDNFRAEFRSIVTTLMDAYVSAGDGDPTYCYVHKTETPR